MNTDPSCVLTPLAELTAVLEKDPVIGYDETREPAMLHIPTAIISCVESTALPRATTKTLFKRNNVEKIKGNP